MSTNDANQSFFGKSQIMESALFSPKEKDVLDVMLQEDQSYTLIEVQKLLELFLTKEVI